MSVVDAGVRALLVVVFAVACVGKLRSRAAAREFAGSIQPLTSVGLLAHVPASALAVAAVAAEVLALALLIVPVTALVGLAASALLLAAYAVGITLALHRGVRVTCRCFGGASAAPLGRPEVVRNLALSLAAGATLAVDLTGALPSASRPALLVALTAAAVLAVIVVRWDDITFVLGVAS